MSSVPAHIKQRVLELRQEINDYRYNYHELDQSTMSEAAADALKHELSQIETKYPELITPDSPTQKVAGAPSSRFPKVAHSTPMISLADVFNEGELQNWGSKALLAGTKEFFTDIKMDGLACALIYKDGKLTQAITRGDGKIGEDVTANVLTLKNIPHAITQETAEIRGEIVIFKQDFDKINAEQQKQNKPLYANPRNLAAGTIRQLDPQVVVNRPLHFIAYDLVAPEQPTFSESYQLLRKLGFQTSNQEKTFPNLKKTYKYLTKLEKSRQKLPFNTDGAVIKVNSKPLFTQMGVAGKAPRGAVAYKFPAEENVSVIKDIVLSVGRTGIVTPVAFFDPVNIAGSTVQYASLYNADEIEKQDIRIGDTVVIYKAGDIIPKIKNVILRLRPKTAKEFNFANELKHTFPDSKFKRDGVAWRLDGDSQATLTRAIIYFAGRATMNILELGKSTAADLVQQGFVKSLPDLYTLRVSDIASLEGYGQTSAEKLVKSIQNSRTAPLDKFVAALGIPLVGIRIAHDLVAHFGTLQNLQNATLNDLLTIDGIGDKVAESVLLWFNDPDNLAMLTRFAELGLNPTPLKVGAKLAGLTFVLTGTFTQSRESLADQIVAEGGKVSGSVSANTSYLVAGTGGGSKRSKAESLSIKIISERQLSELLEA
ncbi:MAG: NAD-dependent DNA ligase LigA [Candidatus Nomurabacteria bacterium]|jgi:DNA ligase (NAD+)|nr:NAD-dependent DNA ligase LigA [Candidatus Nomurabacteria bacterium]